MMNSATSVADVLDVVQGAGVDVEHLSGRDDEGGELAAVVEDGDQGGAGHAVGEFVGVGVPVRGAHRARVEQHPLDGQALQDREVVGGHAPHRAEVGLLDDLAVQQ